MDFKLNKLIAIGLAVSLLANFWLQSKLNQNEPAQTEVLYSQSARLDLATVKLIDQSRQYVYFVIYTITRQNIVDALIAAKLRGLGVEGVVDSGQAIIDQEKPIIKKLQEYGIQLKIPQKDNGLIHMKMLVTDQGYASGSFNWTTSATTYNDEILELGKTQAVHDQYLKIFKTIWSKYKNPDHKK